MSVNLLEQKWRRISKDLGIVIEAPFVVTLPEGRSIIAPVLVKNFGGRSGMIIVEDFSAVRDHTVALWDLGYGYSTLSPPSSDEYDRDSIVDMLTDWGWSGDEANRPSWLLTAR